MVSRDSGWYARQMNSRLIEEMARKCVTVDVEGEKQMDIRKERVKSDEPQRSAVQHQSTIAWFLRKEREDFDLSLGAAELPRFPSHMQHCSGSLDKRLTT